MMPTIITHESFPTGLAGDALTRARLNRAAFRLSQAATLMEEAYAEMQEQGGYSRDLMHQVQEAIHQLHGLIDEVCARLQRLSVS